MQPYLEATTPLGTLVRTSASYWATIVTFKHPIMRGKERLVLEVLRSPGQVRRSKKDSSVHLYYRSDEEYHVCVVVKVLNGEGFIVTAYRTDAVKEGEQLWPV